MVCPNCQEKLGKVSYDNQTILHCSRCSGNFFEQNGINRISADTAKKLVEVGVETEISGQPKFCPKDHAALLPIYDDETIPQNVTLLRCPECLGVFAYADDLLRFKLAQNAKVEYFRLWSKPLPSIKSVVVLSFIFALSIGVYYGFSAVSRNYSAPIQAEDLVQNINTYKTGRYIIVSFRTKSELRSEITILDKTDQTEVIKDISKDFKTFHFVTLSDLNTDHDIYYKIRVFDRSGGKTETEERKFILK